MVGILVSFGDGLFSGTMLVPGGVYPSLVSLRNSGYMVNWWIPAALQKEIIETSKIDECRPFGSGAVGG